MAATCYYMLSYQMLHIFFHLTIHNFRAQMYVLLVMLQHRLHARRVVIIITLILT